MKDDGSIIMIPSKGTIRGRFYSEEDGGSSISVNFDICFPKARVHNHYLSELYRTKDDCRADISRRLAAYGNS
ncbi:MAG: hypothetical protein PHF76_12420 [Bacteroidales bacterium]|nr:hypothetical protein [Bacteroidales bacterium]